MDIVSLLITILVIGLVVFLLIYLIDLIPLPPPFHQVARIVIIAVAVILLIKVLLSVSGVNLTL